MVTIQMLLSICFYEDFSNFRPGMVIAIMIRQNSFPCRSDMQTGPNNRHHQFRTSRRQSICRQVVISLFLGIAVFIGLPQKTQAASRIKDIANFEGIRENILIGYGLVVGLNGTGDTLRNSPFTKQSLSAMLERLGVNIRSVNVSVDNVAAVMVTSKLPPFARQGNHIDVTVSSLGDAESLQGGMLLATPLLAANGEVYAVAQGAVAIGGFSAGGAATEVTKGVPTNGQISNGAIVEREIGFELANLKTFHISLRNPDITTAVRVGHAINKHFGGSVAKALDSGTILVEVPNGSGGMVQLLAQIEQLQVNPDQLARVVINESSGVIVIGKNVRIDDIAIAQGNLTIRVTETQQVSQPGAFARRGQTEVVDRTDIAIDETDNKLTNLQTGVSLQELVDGLNALGVGPRDMISILQTIKAAGALQADIVVQ